MRESADAFTIRGFPVTVGEGWHPLLRKLDADLAAIDPAYHLGGVKEKYGMLSVHADPVTRGVDGGKFYDLIEAAEQASGETCERCGQPGTTIVVGGWAKTRCAACSRY